MVLRDYLAVGLKSCVKVLEILQSGSDAELPIKVFAARIVIKEISAR
jgi:hypothetical protein